MIGGVTRRAASASVGRDGAGGTLSTAPLRHVTMSSPSSRGLGAPAPEQRSHRFADDDLAGLGGRLGVHRDGGVGATDDELPIPVADEEQVEHAGVRTDRDLELQLADGRRDLTRPAKVAPHLHGGGRGLTGMIRPGEEYEQCVSAKLEQLPAAVRRDVQHPGEDPAQCLDELLGTDATTGGELLGQRRETGDVGEDHRALDHPPAPLRLVGHPVEHNAGNESIQATLRRCVVDQCHRALLACHSPARISALDVTFAKRSAPSTHLEPHFTWSQRMAGAETVSPISH